MSETADPTVPKSPAGPPPLPVAAAAAPAEVAVVAGPDPFPDVPALSSERLPPNFRKHVDPKAPTPLRGMAAKGLVPLNPSDTCHALAMLASDADPEIVASARKTAGSLPEKILSAALRDESQNPRVLDFFAEALKDKPTYLELILLNNTTHDLTVAKVAEAGNARLVEIVSNNQLRLLREERVLRALLGNPNASKAVVDGVCDFAVRSGTVLPDLPAMVEAHVRIHGKPPPDPHAPAPAGAPPAPEAITAEDVIREYGEAVTARDAPPMEERKRLNLTQRVMKMSISQKIKLATLGNKEARGILLRDTNKLVCLAAINSPRITDGEVLTLANSKTCQDDVLRTIVSNREWTKVYQVKIALVKNPKVPLALSLKFLSTLRDSEVSELAKNKNVPSGIRLQAKKMIDKKTAPAKAGDKE